ncbi:MAG: hypothetical protein J3R72DRAFT_19505 [Linnemannia gamsii]|nr:MAG: hypothetical protein J3R72DRAFT_19505 [Linnemannia gamsii]
MLPLPLGALSSSSSSALSGSSGKTPLNVIFIIDTHSPIVDSASAHARRAATLLKRTLVRILLYFQCNMDPKFQWTFTFFNSRGTQEIGLVTKRMPRALDMQTIEDCVQEYTKIVTNETASTPTSTSAAGTSKAAGINHGSPCHNLRRQLVHSLADFGLDIASYQSPIKPLATLARSQSLQKHFPPVNIRNYIYVISPLPQTWSETTFFLDGRRPNSNNLLEPRKSDILDVLKGIKDIFFELQLWDRFLDQRTSLSWIDTNTQPDSDDAFTKTQTRISTTLLIRSTLELIMRAFGGHIIPQSILTEAAGSKDLYSFSTIFQTYRSLQISPGLGITMSKDTWQALRSVPSAPFPDSRTVKLMWSGELLCADSLHFVCSFDISTPLSFDESDCSLSDQIVSMHVVKRIQLTSLNSHLHSVRISHTMLCFPRENKDVLCERALYLLRSLNSKNDALLLQITLLKVDAEEEHMDTISGRQHRTLQIQALLHSGANGSGTLHILEGFSYLEDAPLCKNINKTSARTFNMAMMERSLSGIGAFVDQQTSRHRSRSPYCLEEMPADIAESFEPPRETTTAVAERSTPSKTLPGDSVRMDEHVAVGLEAVDSIDDLCLGIRRAYIKHLYNNEYTVVDYVKRLNAASKEITALAAKQSVPLKDAQQKLVAFMIEFLRIWPSKLGSKYKQVDKELNIGKSADTRTQDRYIILQDERPELDSWKSRVNTSVKDNDVRMFVRKLKTKDTQIQIVQNLHILLLISKYGLEENKPFKKDPGALKTTNHFMDELCISAVVDDRPAPGFLSPQTPRSKDMDPAKKFFTRAVARYYGPALPKVVEKLSVKCGVETSLLKSPRPSRGSKRAGLHRSVSMGVLQKPSRLDLTAATQIRTDGPPSSSSVKTPMEEVVAPKHGFPMSRQSTSDNPARSALDSIFKNRQVAMARGSVKGRSGKSSSATSALTSMSSSTAQPTQGRAVAPHSQAQLQLQSHSRPSSQRSKSMNSILDEMEDENAPPKLAKLKLKKFYHDKESEEVLKMFRRKGPLSKADVADSGPSNTLSSQHGNDDQGGDDVFGELGQYLPRQGTTSWGVITSSSQPSEESTTWGLQSPGRQRDVSPPRTSSSLLIVPSEFYVPSTPVGHQGRNYNQEDSPITPSTPSGRSQLRRYYSEQVIGGSSHAETDRIPSTPTRRDRVHEGRSFAAQLRGGRREDMFDANILGSPGKRRRGGTDSDDANDEGYEKRILLDAGASSTPRSIIQPHLTSKFISSPSGNHNRTRRNIDFSIFND